MLADWLGIGTGVFLHWALAAGITLLVLDVLFCTEFLSWVSLLVFALWGTQLLGLPLQWSVLVFLGFLALGFAFYYTLWVHVVRRFVMGFLNRNSYKESREMMAGRRGEVRKAGGVVMVRCGDELLPVTDACKAGLQEGDRVRIASYEDGKARVEKITAEQDL